MRAICDRTLQDIVQRFRCAVLCLQLGQPQPQALFVLQMHHSVIVDCSSYLNGISVNCRIGILNPILLHALDILVYTDLDRDLHNGLACLNEACFLGLLRLLQPHIAIRCDTIGGQGINGTGQNKLHHLFVTLCLLQLRGCDPNNRTGWDVLSCLVQHSLCLLVGRQLCQGQPHFNTVWNTLHSTAKHNPRFHLIFQADGLLPQTDGIRDEF
mmetsp:Transcript_85369/g.169337  ORF Transcript_85369/g.169337 Transcript_85369/m.169337 type:complete len:212 (+) Transcript_85369:332-967(+)